MNNRIKQIRKDAQLTQAEFGAKLSVSQNYVWMMETGNREPSDRTLRDICRIFNVSEQWLRTGAGEMHGDENRAAELAALVKSRLIDAPESFQTKLVTVLLRFDPDGPEWSILERIYDELTKDREQ